MLFNSEFRHYLRKKTTNPKKCCLMFMFCLYFLNNCLLRKRNVYNIDDEAVIEAINTHTTGCPAMTLLQKIIFVSDYIEPLRCEAPRLDLIRNIAFNDLDLSIVYILEDTIKYLKANNKVIDKTTYETLNYYKGDNEQALDWLKRVSPDIPNCEDKDVKFYYASAVLKILF